MKVIALGTGGWIPSSRRETSCFLVKERDELILFDAGTGISHLLRKSLKNRIFKNTRILRIMISHFHLDHVIGITWLPQFWNGNISFHVPMPPYNELDGGDSLNLLTSPPLFGLPVKDFPGNVEILPINSDEIHTDHLSISVIPQKHDGGSLGFRINELFAYCTDTDPNNKHVEFLNRVKLAFIDGMYNQKTYNSVIENEGGSDHGSSLSVARIAKEASINELALIHIDPVLGRNGESRLLKEARTIFPRTMIPNDLQEWDLK